MTTLMIFVGGYRYLRKQQCCGSGIQCFFTRGSGMAKTSENIPDHISESFVKIFGVENTEILCCGSGSRIRCLVDPGSEILDGKILIPDSQHWKTALEIMWEERWTVCF